MKFLYLPELDAKSPSDRIYYGKNEPVLNHSRLYMKQMKKETGTKNAIEDNKTHGHIDDTNNDTRHN